MTADGSPTPPTESMKAAMSLDGDVAKLERYYDEWAATYDADVTSEDYDLPAAMVTLLRAVIASGEQWSRFGHPEIRIIDAGCGTGLLGVELHRAGYRDIVGLDLSAEMAAQAARRGVYRAIESGVDLTRPPRPELVRAADIVTVAGVFTVGHVPPATLRTIAPMVRPGGLLLVSVRRAYYDDTDYEQTSQTLIDEGRFDLVVRIDDGPYTMDSTAHYFAYEVLAADP